MNELVSADIELAVFLESVKNDELQTWQRRRTSEEMGTFVARRLAMLDGLEDDFELAV